MDKLEILGWGEVGGVEAELAEEGMLRRQKRPGGGAGAAAAGAALGLGLGGSSDPDEAAVAAATAPSPSLFSLSLRSRLASLAVLRGPWAIVPLDAQIKASTLTTIQNELTLRPVEVMAGVRKMGEPVVCYVLGDSGEGGGGGGGGGSSAVSPYMLVPRAYFTSRFGVPAADETALGEAVREAVRFQGSLRDDRQRRFLAQLEDTLFRQRLTIALGSAEPGCGKTVMFLYLWATRLRRKCLVIVHGLAIVAQWIAAARRFCPGARVGIIHQGTWQVRNRDIVVASSDTLAARAGGFASSLWREFGVVCFDEAHHIMASTFMSIYRTCMHARYCLSLTGTPYRKDGLTSAMPFLTGPNAAFMKNTDPVHVRVVHFLGGLRNVVLHKWGPGKGNPNEAAMITAFVEDALRTRLVADMVVRSVLAGRRVLVLCARNELRLAIKMLCLEMLAPHGDPPHRVAPLAPVEDEAAAGEAAEKELEAVRQAEAAAEAAEAAAREAEARAEAAEAAAEVEAGAGAGAGAEAVPKTAQRKRTREEIARAAAARRAAEARARARREAAAAARRARREAAAAARRAARAAAEAAAEARRRVREAATEERVSKQLLDLYDAMHVEAFRKEVDADARRALVRRMREAEARVGEAARARCVEAEGFVPRVVPELAPSGDPVPAPWVEELVAGEDYTVRMNKQHGARALLATWVLAREALDVPGLDTVIFATPASDVRQAVGRIRRTGAAASSPDALDTIPLLQQRVALVVDLVDTFPPFQRWSEVRRAYYRAERFHISDARVTTLEPWDAVGQPAAPSAPPSAASRASLAAFLARA
jgi:hypothetical protein